MRLINTRTLKLEQFGDENVPSYAMYLKILAFCKEAWSHGFGYGWVDTCCINKASSTELAEAISSMFTWYSKAVVCFAYLSDVHIKITSSAFDSLLASSVWFERGWTLQELIAPRDMRFYDRDWICIGTKRHLQGKLADITGIDEGVLGGISPSKCSIAQRMSWAANRKTLRVEDRAYSLIGIFDVSLPMIYGEGDKAFRRLQEEIVKHSDDHSIFAWSIGLPENSRRGQCGLFAPTPKSFAYCQDVVRAGSSSSSKAFTVTNKGLSIELFTIPWSMGTYLALLDCTKICHPAKRLGILLERLSSAGQYARVRCGPTTIVNVDLKTVERREIAPRQRQILIRKSITDSTPNQKYGFWLRDVDVSGIGADELAYAQMWSREHSRPVDETSGFIELPAGHYGTVGAVRFVPKKKLWPYHRLSWIKFGFDDDFNPVCMLGNQKSLRCCFYRNPKFREPSKSFDSDLKARERVLSNKWISQYYEKKCLSKSMETKTFCILKGDKGQIDTEVPFLNIRISIKLAHYPTQAGETDDTQAPWTVWTIDVSQLNPPMTRALRAVEDKVTDERLLWLSFCGLCILFSKPLRDLEEAQSMSEDAPDI